MSKIRIGALLLALILLGTPALASSASWSPSEGLASLWAEAVEVVERLVASVTRGDEPGPPSRDVPAPNALEEDPPDDEFGPGGDPHG